MCGLPPEYCEFDKKNDLTECKSWLEKAHPDLHAEVYPDGDEEEKDENAAEKPKQKGKKKGVKFNDSAKKI